VPVNKKGE